MIERERDMSSLLVGGSLLSLPYQLSELMADLAVGSSLDFGGFCASLSISSAFTVLLRYLQFSSIKLLVEIFHRLMR